MHAEEDGDSSSASSMSSTGTVMPASPQHAPSTVGAWAEHFEQELFLGGPSQAQFHVYITAPTNLSKDPLFVCHHGAGSSGLSFALFATHVRRLLPNAGIMSVDCRGHGLTVANPTSEPTDYSLSTLSDDLVQMIRLSSSKLLWSEQPQMVLVGHSLGGAVVTDVAKSGVFGSKLIGFAVIDVVEGSAMEALKSMQALLAARPASFPSVDAAVEWHTRTRTLRNPDSATVSVPVLLEDSPSGKKVWRTDLAGTKPFWEDWYTGMSKNFLAGKAAKLLLLAGTDRLDKELMIGQMQGKFQLQVFPEAGHFVQEDVPERTAEVVVEFYKRNDRSKLVLPPKVSDLIAQGKKV